MAAYRYMLLAERLRSEEEKTAMRIVLEQQVRMRPTALCCSIGVCNGTLILSLQLRKKY